MISTYLSRKDTVVAFSIGLAAFLIYGLTLGRTVTGEDSGELIAAAYTLGVPHPPGYPLWTLLAHAFTWLPMGTVAWRVNLLSAVLASAAVGVVYGIARHLGLGRSAGAAGAFAFAFSREFWEQSVIAEVYSLNALLVAACVLALLRWSTTRRRGWLVAAGMAFGFGLTNHHSVVVLAPVLAGYVLVADPRIVRSWRVVGGLTLAMVLPLTLYAYLPLRSAADPPVDWGNPETWAAFRDVITRKQYAFLFTENPRSLALFVGQCRTFLSLYVQEFSPWLAWIPWLGAVVLWRRHRLGACLVFGVGLATWLAVVLLNNFALEEEAIWVNNVFWIPVYLVLGLGMAGAVDGFMGWTASRRVRRPLAWAVIAGVVLSPLLWNYRYVDKSDYQIARDHGLNILRTMERNALYLPSADHATFPVLYLQAVEGLRPDILVGNKYGYIEPALYADMPETAPTGPAPRRHDAKDRQIEAWLVEHYADRPVYMSQKVPLTVPGARLVNAGLLYRVVRDGETPNAVDHFARYRWTQPDVGNAVPDFTARAIRADVAFARARAAFDRGETDAAVQHVETALASGGKSKEALNNAGSLCAENGALEAARAHYTAALAMDETYGLTLRNLAILYQQVDNPKAVLSYVERLLRQDPLDPEANWWAYDSLRGQGRYEEALAQLERMATFPYEDARVYRELGMHHLHETGDPRKARELLERSLALNPDQPDVREALERLDRPTPRRAPGPDLPPGVPAVPNPVPGEPRGGPNTPGPLGGFPSVPLPGGVTAGIPSRP